MSIFNVGRRVYRFGLENLKITIGVSLVLLLILFGYAGPLFVDLQNADVASLASGQPPSAEHWLGTDAHGRDMLAWLIDAVPDSLRVGVIAAALGVMIGATVGFVAGYYGGFVDAVARTRIDIALALPGLLVLIVWASMVEVTSLEFMAIVIALFAWMGPARVMRAQVLTLRERQYIELARMSGEKGIYIVFFELMPNMMPFLLASFVGSLAGAILAAVGLEFLGLGPSHISTLGNILYWANFNNAVIRGMWWWWGSPIVILVILFAGLFIASIGLDEWANPRLRKRA